MGFKGLIAILCLSLAVVGLGATLPRTIKAWQTTRARLEEKLAELDSLRREKEGLEERIRALETDPAFQELTLRRFGYAREGETLFLVLKRDELKTFLSRGESEGETIPPKLLEELSAKLREEGEF